MIGYGQGGTVTPNIPFGSESLLKTPPAPFPWAAGGLAALSVAQSFTQARKMRQQRAAQERLRAMDIADILRQRKEGRGEIMGAHCGRDDKNHSVADADCSAMMPCPP